MHQASQIEKKRDNWQPTLLISHHLLSYHVAKIMRLWHDIYDFTETNRYQLKKNQDVHGMMWRSCAILVSSYVCFTKSKWAKFA